MRDERDLQKEIARVTEIGRANLRAIRLAENWCGHLKIEACGALGNSRRVQENKSPRICGQLSVP